MEIKIEAYETREKTVTTIGNACHVYVPKGWIGKKVMVLLTEKLESRKEV